MSDLSASLLSMPPFGGPDPWTSPLSRTDWSGVAATRAAVSDPDEADEADETGDAEAAEARRTEQTGDAS